MSLGWIALILTVFYSAYTIKNKKISLKIMQTTTQSTTQRGQADANSIL